MQVRVLIQLWESKVVGLKVKLCLNYRVNLELCETISKLKIVWEYSSAIEHLPSMYLAIGSVFSMEEEKVTQILYAIKRI